MIDEAISIAPRDAAAMKTVGKLLRSGQTTLLGAKGERMEIPKPLGDLLTRIVKKMAEGQSVMVMTEEKHLTTQQAAEMLGMSRPYVIRLLDASEMPYVFVGKHRRIALRDIVAFAKKRSERRAALDKMARDAYRAGFYDSAEIPEGGQDE